MSRFAFALLSVLLLCSRYFAQDPAVVYGVATPAGGGVTSVLRMATYAGAGAPLTTVDLSRAIQGEYVEIHQNNNTRVAEILALVDDAAGGTERIVSYSNPFNNRSTLAPFPWSESQILSRQTLQSQALLTGQGISLVRITDFAVDDSPAGAGTLIVVGTDAAQDTVVVRVTAAGVAVAATTIGTNFIGLGGAILRPLVAVDPAGLAAPSSAAGNCQIVINEFLPSGASSPIVPYHASLTSAFAVATGLTSIGSGFFTNITQVADIAFNSIAGNAFPVLMILPSPSPTRSSRLHLPTDSG